MFCCCDCDACDIDDPMPGSSSNTQQMMEESYRLRSEEHRSEKEFQDRFDASFDVLNPTLGAVPETVWNAVRRWTGVAYQRLFAPAAQWSARASPKMVVPPASDPEESDAPLAPLILVCTLGLGWWLSTPRPARPW